MSADKSCVLFDGGKRIKLAPNTKQGILLSKDGSGNWNITIKAQITAMEAKNVIFKYSELDPKGGTFEDVFPNMVFIPAMDAGENPKEIELQDESELFPGYDRDLGGFIMLKLVLAGTGKTQNGKTQNIHV